MKKLSILLVVAIISGCGSSNTATSTNNLNQPDPKNVGYGNLDQDEVTGSIGSVDPTNEGQELSDFLRRVPGVIVMGRGDNARIRVRGAVTSQTGPQGPLFVVDNVPISNHYSEVAGMVDLNEIKSVDVIKDVGSANIYGSRAKDGVIMINLKKTDFSEKKNKGNSN